jgi:hypothetical protein
MSNCTSLGIGMECLRLTALGLESQGTSKNLCLANWTYWDVVHADITRLAISRANQRNGMVCQAALGLNWNWNGMFNAGSNRLGIAGWYTDKSLLGKSD